MKKVFSIVIISGLLVACGGSSAKSEESGETTELSAAQETALADSLSESIESDTEELKQVTEENLEEIDSLLENF